MANGADVAQQAAASGSGNGLANNIVVTPRLLSASGEAGHGHGHSHVASGNSVGQQQ